VKDLQYHEIIKSSLGFSQTSRPKVWDRPTSLFIYPEPLETWSCKSTTINLRKRNCLFSFKLLDERCPTVDCCHRHVRNKRLLSLLSRTLEMEEVDYVAARVSFSAVLGLLGGATFATWKGRSLRGTSIKVAASCAIVSTALFCTERLAHVVLRKIQLFLVEKEPQRTFASHAVAGVAGGALNGQLYIKSPVRGMILFVPVMMGVAVAEMEWEKEKLRRRAVVANRNDNRDQNHHASS
jgi:hypothetical protein